MKKSVLIMIILIVSCLFFSTALAERIVIYFSCTGTTAKMANWIAEAVGGDLYQLLPKEPYTEEDLKYYTDCRADREQADDEARPEIANLPGSLQSYDEVFLGYPIWHGKAPKIMYTLLENVDLSGKTIIPFCTSGSSPIGNSATILQQFTAGSATWLEGKRFGKDSTASEVCEWIDTIELPEPKKKIYITANGQTKAATLSDNASAKALYALLEQGDITVAMHDYGSFEKVGPLGTSIVQCDEKITTSPGDIILYQGDQITIYYAENTWTFTLLGHIDGATNENMKAFLGDGDPTVVFSKDETIPPDPEDLTDILILPTSLETVDIQVLSGTNPQYIIVPDSVKEIKSKAFSNCNNLLYLKLPAGEMTISDDILDGIGNVTIICTENSPADQWAKEKGLKTRYVLQNAD